MHLRSDKVMRVILWPQNGGWTLEDLALGCRMQGAPMGIDGRVTVCSMA